MQDEQWELYNRICHASERLIMKVSKHNKQKGDNSFPIIWVIILALLVIAFLGKKQNIYPFYQQIIPQPIFVKISDCFVNGNCAPMASVVPTCLKRTTNAKGATLIIYCKKNSYSKTGHGLLY